MRTTRLPEPFALHRVPAPPGARSHPPTLRWRLAEPVLDLARIALGMLRGRAWRKRRLFGDLAPLVPPLRWMYEGPRDYDAFKTNGDEYFRILVDHCGLRPNHRILDLGSGLGRKTLPLLRYLGPQGSYLGLEVYRPAVDWCRDRITPANERFRFEHIDVYNGFYHPEGVVQPRELRFPCPDRDFDLVLLGSVFTHMLPDDLPHYLAEIRRVLRPDARALVSYFLLNEASEALIRSGDADPGFAHRFGDHARIERIECPEAVVAHSESWILQLHQAHDLQARIHPGTWCGQDGLTFQDVVIAAPIR